MDSNKRQTAFKVWIKQVISGTYVKEEGLRPNYVILGNGKKVSRVNLLGTVVSVSTEGMQSFSLDDGTGTINVNAFEPLEKVKNLQLGTMVFVVGRPRQFGNEIYLLPEIVTEIKNQEWIQVRKAELSEIKQEPSQEEKPQEKIEESDNSSEKILSFIKEKDSGEGVSVEEVSAVIPNAEKVIERLLLNGDLFEVKPGKIKILE